MADQEDEILETLKDISQTESDEMQEGIDKALKGVFEENMLPKDAMGLPDEMLEGIYSQAYNMYNTGKYDEASVIFRLLLLLDPLESKYGLGLAAAAQMMKDYQLAFTMYNMVFVTDPENPLAHYHAADCLIQMDTPEMAHEELKKAVELCGENKDYEKIKERAERMIEKIVKGEIQDLKHQEAKVVPKASKK